MSTIIHVQYDESRIQILDLEKLMSQLKIKSILSVGITIGFIIGFLDIIYSILIETPIFFKEFALIIPPFTATVVLVTLIYCLVAFIIYLLSIIVKWLKKSYQMWNFLFFMLILIILNRFHLTYFAFVDTILFKLIIILFVSLFLVQVYTNYTIHSPRQFNKGVITATPVLIFKFLFVVWLLTYFEFSIHKELQIFLLFFMILGTTFLLLSLNILYSNRIAPIIINTVVIFILFIFSSTVLWIRITPVSKYPYKHDGQKKIKHIIFISIDALRADFLTCYNSDAIIRTPFIDKLAEEGTVFLNTVSSAPWTLPSFASIMTGFSPAVHHTKYPNNSMPDTLTTLAEYLHQNGYYTAAIGSNPFLKIQSNLDQGFSEYNFFPKSTSTLGNSFGMWIVYKKLFMKHFLTEPTTKDLTDLAIQWIKKHNEKNFFLWLHYFDPHMPYSPPVKYLPSIQIQPSIGNSFSRLRDIRTGRLILTEKEKEWIRHLYAAEIRYVDDNLGRLIRELKKNQLYDESLVILLSDHGEEFWEHNGFEHGHTLYQELLHIPLIIKLPRFLIEGNQVHEISTMVSTQSLLPTVLDLCIVDFDQNQYPHTSLMLFFERAAEKYRERPIYSTTLLYDEDRESVIWNGNKYIRFLYSDQQELYDLNRDPKEKRSLIASLPGLRETGEKLLKFQYDQDWQIINAYQHVQPKTIELDNESLERLRSLGYVK